MAKVCKSGGEGTFAERHGNGEVAPIPDLALAGAHLRDKVLLIEHPPEVIIDRRSVEEIS
jgi:hypothetical protein